MRVHRPHCGTGRPLAWAAGFFLLITGFLPILLDQPTAAVRENVLSAPDSPLALTVDDLTIETNPVGGKYRTCPSHDNESKRAFCRNFNSRPLAACGQGDDFYLILSDGEVHRVNDALIGKNGNFDATFQSDSVMQLAAAWLPANACNPVDGPPEIIAMDYDGRLQHFDGDHWHSVGMLTSNLAK